MSELQAGRTTATEAANVRKCAGWKNGLMNRENGRHSWRENQGSKGRKKKRGDKLRVHLTIGVFWLTKLTRSELGGCSCPAGWILTPLCPASDSARGSPRANWSYCGGQDV